MTFDPRTPVIDVTDAPFPLERHLLPRERLGDPVLARNHELSALQERVAEARTAASFALLNAERCAEELRTARADLAKFTIMNRLNQLENET